MWKAAWSVGSFLKHRDTEAQRDLRELCDSVFPKSAQGRLLGLWVFFLKHRGAETQRDLRELCDSVFPKSAQGRLLGLWVLF